MALADLGWDEPAAARFLPLLTTNRSGQPTVDPVAAWKLIGWERDGQIVACAAASRRDDRLELHAIAVPEEQRGRGFGRALITALAEAVNATALIASADADCAGFYQACGFTITTENTTSGPRLFRCTLPLDATPSPETTPPGTLSELEAAVRAAWSAETADDPVGWSPDNPAQNHCDITALLVRELLGGEILIANVIRDGRRTERHAWNRLPSGLTIDLTRSQFRAGEQFDTPKVAEPVATRRSPERYELFAARVRAALGN